jgi:RNA polymerase sigma-70 factor (ECF subfamily)
LEALYLRLERPLYNVVYRWVWNGADAQEIVQAAFLKLWRMRERVEPATVEPLVYRIALNLASNRRRSRRLWRWTGLDAASRRAGEDASPHDALETAERVRALRSALETLPAGLRRVVVLCEMSEMTHAQVAAVLGIPTGTVGSRRHRALELLRRWLAAQGAPVETLDEEA